MSIREIYEKAVQMGIKNICFTSHHEPAEILRGKYNQSLMPEVLEKYKKEFQEVKDDGRINAYFGVEMSYTEGFEEDIKRFLSENKFDFVLGSVHYTLGMQLADSKIKDKIQAENPDKICDEYLRIIKKAIKTGMFDSIAHIDIYKRLMKEEPDFKEHKKDWEEVAKLLIKHKTGFEINTSYTKDKNSGTYPNQNIIKLFIDKGAKIITIGSDAHRPDGIGQGIDNAEKMLKGYGAENVCLFKKRKPRFIAL
jgi:histidinol-phosphatase (PHP family)